jgi:hypothetical protein
MGVVGATRVSVLSMVETVATTLLRVPHREDTTPTPATLFP